jgi:hypothetical protein
MPGAEYGPGPISYVRSSGQRNGGYCLPADAGDGGPVAAGVPAGFPPERARHGRHPGSGTVASAPSPLTASCRLSHAFPLDVFVMEIADGLIQRNTIYYEGLPWPRQIGMLPSQGSRADRALVFAFNAKTRLRRQRR